MFRGRFIQRSSRFRAGDRDPARVENRVLAAFGFAVAVEIWDASSSWPSPVAILVAVVAAAPASPLIWYLGWSLAAFLGFDPSQATFDVEGDGGEHVACRTQCRLAVSRIQAFIARIEALAGEARGSRGRVESIVLSEYTQRCETWILDILEEAWHLGACVPRSVKSRLSCESADDLRVLLVLLRDVEDELGMIATSSQPARSRTRRRVA